MKTLFGRLFAKKPEAPPPPLADTEADAGLGFGYKTGWITVPSEDPDSVLAALGAENIVPCTWRRGMAAVQAELGPVTQVFATPAKNGHVCLVLGLQGAMEYDEPIADMFARLEALSKRFGRVAYFGSYRVVDYVAWAFADGGRITRAFATVEGQVQVLTGEPLAEERALGLPFERGQSEESFSEALYAQAEGEGAFPNEAMPLILAAETCVDPRTFDGVELGLGRLAVLAAD
ncbi:hypothetical protein [Gymnodinialimonas hymeniacidonis]|uniref:hypothetical protein n=1 Tax=Gymnodinialimonas hymeniacidonis TaxID=3126508 RepID=UPI0034C69536